MNHSLQEGYWVGEFEVSIPDLDRLAQDIERLGRAQDAGKLAHNLVRRRLLYGPEAGAKLAPGKSQNSASVQWWDRVEEVFVGEYLIFLHRIDEYDLRPCLGEVVATRDLDSGMVIEVFIAEEQRQAQYQQPPRGSRQWKHIQESYRTIRQRQRELVEEQRFEESHDEEIALILSEHGDVIAERLIEALSSDPRFVRLSGRWFLRELALKPSPEQIETLAWSLAHNNQARLTQVLAEEVTPVATEDRWLFGVYLALSEHPELFENVDPGPQPRWMLAGPPPGAFVPRRAAYDPETFRVVCRAGVEAKQPVVQRLWDLELLEAVL